MGKKIYEKSFPVKLNWILSFPPQFCHAIYERCLRNKSVLFLTIICAAFQDFCTFRSTLPSFTPLSTHYPNTWYMNDAFKKTTLFIWIKNCITGTSDGQIYISEKKTKRHYTYFSTSNHVFSHTFYFHILFYSFIHLWNTLCTCFYLYTRPEFIRCFLFKDTFNVNNIKYDKERTWYSCERRKRRERDL